MFGNNEPVYRLFRIGPRGKEQRGLVYESQLNPFRKQVGNLAI
jgi:hypothetical protein